MAVLTSDTFEFVLANELKRALRSQNFVTLVLLEPRGERSAEDRRNIASLINPELRETDLLAVGDTAVSMVLLDADMQNSMRVIDRVLVRLEHYQFGQPLEIEVGAACCPTHGADVETLRRAAAQARTAVARRTPRGSAQA
jgi:GGDEF domain-containing protein